MIKSCKIKTYPIDDGYHYVVLVDDLEFTLKQNIVNYCIQNGKLENGNIYIDFEILEYRKEKMLLPIGCEKYIEIKTKNEIKKLDPLKDLEVGKVYIANNSNNYKFIYKYIGDKYYYKLDKYLDIKEKGFSKTFIGINIFESICSIEFDKKMCKQVDYTLEQHIKFKDAEIFDFEKAVYGDTIEEIDSKLLLKKLAHK